MEQILESLKNMWWNRTICCCIVCPGTTLHICTNIQMWGAPSALVQLVPWLSLPVCELQTKIGVSQGRNKAGKLEGSSSSPSVTLILNHWKKKQKKKTVHTSEDEAALTKWHIAPRSTLPSSPSLDASSSPSLPQNGWHLLALLEPDTLPPQWPWDKDEGVIVRQ